MNFPYRIARRPPLEKRRVALDGLGVEPQAGVFSMGARPEEILARAGRSFYLAGKFLPVERRAAATRLYAFCRELDDLADESGDAVQIEAVAAAIETGDNSHPLAALYFSLGAVDPVPAITLARALRDDTGPVEIPDERALLRYCHGVAGTVGLMMARVLGATHPAAAWHAVDLGIALQLTNIARDIRGDADLQRRYVPETWLALPPGAIRGKPVMVHHAALRCLELAEPYYASGLAGLSYLPPNCRRGILIAGTVYREIGMELQRKGPHRAVDRVIVPFHRKASLIARSYLGNQPSIEEAPQHARVLHHHLEGLAGTRP